MSTKKEMFYEGKAKKMFATEQENEVIVYYKDDATAFNGQKKAQIDGKGVLNNQIASLIFEYLKSNGVPTHFISKLNDREQLVQRVKIIPLEVITRNFVAGSMAKRLGVEEGVHSPISIFEICYKDDALGDPLINDYHAVFLGAATFSELKEIYKLAGEINELLKKLFDKMNVNLIDFKLEFGKTSDGKIVLADEISPDTSRLWDKDTNKKLDKDRFRRDLGGFIEAYEDILGRLKKALGK